MVITTSISLLLASFLIIAANEVWADLELLGKGTSSAVLKNKSVACFDDGTFTKKFPRFVGSGLDARQCKEACVKSNHRYAERRRQGECWCGNHIYAKYRREVPNCDCHGKRVDEKKSCVFRLDDSARDAEHKKSKSTQRSQPSQPMVRGHCKGKECERVVKPKPKKHKSISKQKMQKSMEDQTMRFTMPLKIDLFDKHYLLENPILEAAFDLITKDWLNECESGTDSFLYTHSSTSSSRRLYGDALSMRKNKQTGKGDGTCKGNKCPKKTIISLPGLTRSLTADGNSNESSACSETLLDRLQAYKQPPTLSEGFQEVTKLTLETDNDNVVKSIWDPQDCGTECQKRENQRSKISEIYSYYNIAYDADSHECTWEGIACDEHLWIYRIFLENHSSLSGKTIPAAFGGLSDLEDISLVDTGVVGTIPASIGNLLKLFFLDFSLNNLSGEIPSEFGNLSNVRIIQIQDNALSGTIPANLSTLSQLRYLDMSDNQLTGTLNDGPLCSKSIVNGNLNLTVDCPFERTKWSGCKNCNVNGGGYLTGLKVDHGTNLKHITAASKDEPAYLESKYWRCNLYRFDKNASLIIQNCKLGQYVTRIEKKIGVNGDLTKMRCCRPRLQNTPPDADKCYEHNVSFEVNDDWQQCDEGYYVSGIQTDNCTKLFCLTKVVCCAMGKISSRQWWIFGSKVYYPPN